MFSRPQLIRFFRPMVDKAWKAHCDRECITESTTASKDGWYRAELKKVFGVDTTKRLNKSKDFDRAMAHFEELADEGIVWQVKLLQGDAVRARYQLEEMAKLLRLDEVYLSTMREQMGIPAGPLSVEQAVRLRVALLYHVRRRQARAKEVA
jgi:DNA primase large subunit